MNKFKKWLDKGDGGQWYEPYITNKDVLIIMGITLIVSTIMFLGCYFNGTF